MENYKIQAMDFEVLDLITIISVPDEEDNKGLCDLFPKKRQNFVGSS